MWVRILGQKGSAEAIVLPPPALRALGWQRGDFLLIRMNSRSELLLTKFNPVQLPDRVLNEIEPLPEIKYE